ncbi:isopentenyl-diphosphate Delta-isomerase [Solitalea canadensis]|uniref:Isopentenyl-diphosphate delta-isomerase n=1 Tax=Solitalea canadensis (strain ATCC 29591 / DSM 3403 / JCM 21819 / LMG 8368 / NBRC 15130 / NCIMB 12057 / USAM 9D) TaxID=929556 RepID=H8KMS4_SOLCM|nr:isopentenyl-diphosphate Delta-isomerase [Solitalea canadensis]AFD09327.1 isopentenyl-diphosphate delta-isomerase, type 1 [Solitalea canadensis DSM 3403]
MKEKELILVNIDDEVVGFGEKLPVHEQGLLHRAFSIMIFNDNNEVLIHKRAIDKYHSGGLWTNACCSHPLKDEAIEITLHRKLQEEMGFDCSLTYSYKFIYKAEFNNGLTEHELDYVYIGNYNGMVNPDPLEASDYKWVNMDVVKKDVELNPEIYTEWFKIILKQL